MEKQSVLFTCKFCTIPVWERVQNTKRGTVPMRLGACHLSEDGGVGDCATSMSLNSRVSEPPWV